MKKLFLTLIMAVFTTAVLQAQQISVVSSGGVTSLYRTLGEAIQGAEPNSVIYLPGGGFPISDDVKITKKLTIIGIGHKPDNDNVDGITTIDGNIYFNAGSDGSALIGCRIPKKWVVIGDDGPVNDVMVKLCRISYGISIRNSNCSGTIICRNYLKNPNYASVSLGNSEATIMNNIIMGSGINNMGSGKIANNILYNYSALDRISNAIVDGNIFLNSKDFKNCNFLETSGNMCLNDVFGDDPINLQANSWDDVFVNYNNGDADPTSDFHFKEGYKQYESKVGIYAGDGFDDKALVPVPYIVAKHVDEQTDASGMLNIKIRVKAGK